jgi:3-hydroxyisobutyrate dehydrogenase-like beta-hydroxyacid dehydrogenase
MMRTKPAIGFVGLGRMGGAMSARLLAAGFAVDGTSRDLPAAESLVAKGLRWHDTPRAVAEAVDVVFTSIPDDDALSAVASGPDGIVAGLAQDAVWIDMSTVSPRTSREVAARVHEHGATMLDAPVSGSVPQAEAGTLTIMVGGDEDAYRRIEPLLRTLGSPTWVGANGRGLALKLAINISLAVQMLAFAEGLVLAERLGVDSQRALDVMIESPIASPMLKARGAIVLDVPDDAWFDISLMQKDVRLALDAGREAGVPLPTAERANELLTLARGLGYGGRDIAAFVPVLEQLAHEKPNAA